MRGSSTKGYIYAWDGKSKWNRMPGQARDISLNGRPPFARIWVVGVDKSQYGGSVFTWNGKNWTRTNGKLVNITTDYVACPSARTPRVDLRPRQFTDLAAGSAKPGSQDLATASRQYEAVDRFEPQGSDQPATRSKCKAS